MEEEIITPEEETFDYNKLRYILDKDGYVCHASLGALIVCDLGECTEYNGEVPEEYETLIEWYETQVSENKLNAWKIVNGNLVYDPDRDYKLALQYDEDEKQYRHVTQKELGITTSEQEKAYNDLFPSHTSYAGEIVTIDDTVNQVGNLPTDEVTIQANHDVTGLIELEFIGGNFLPSTSISGSNNGINYKVEKDKKITISGTSTDKSTFNLAGSDTSLRKILTFKRKDFDDRFFPNDTLNYLISGLDENTNLEFYYYDGTNRTLVGTYNNGLITFDEDTPVTQVVLTIESGITIDTTIAPMLSVIATNNDYPLLTMEKNSDGQYVYSNELSFFTSEKYQATVGNIHFIITTPTEISSLTTDRGGFIISPETLDCSFVYYNAGSSDYNYIGCEYSVETFPYEEYKNNYTLINLGDNTLTDMDLLKLKDNQIILVKNGEEFYLGDVVMPRTYEPITHVYSHQQVASYITYKDPRNIDITKISLKGLVQIMDIENTYNFTGTDTNKIFQYLSGNTELTQEEFELYDINGDGRITGSDMATMLKMIDGEIPSTIKGTFEINTTSSQRTLVLRDEEGKIKTSIGLNGIVTPSLSCDNLRLGNIPMHEAITYSENETIIGTYLGKTLYRRVVIIDVAAKGTASPTKDELGISDADIIIINEGASTAHYSSGTGLGYSPINYYASSSDAAQVYLSAAGKLTIKNNNSNARTYYIVLEYTKIEQTPDTPAADLVKTISAAGSKGHHKFTLQVNEDGTSDNASSMSYTFKLSPTSNGYNWADWTKPEYRISYTITIGENTYTGYIPEYNGTSTVTLKSGSDIIIEHDADGSKTINIGFTVKDTTGVYYTTGSASVSDTMILTEIG